MTAEEKRRVHHYAACAHCELWSWEEDKEEARDAADSHTDQTKHSTYTDTVFIGQCDYCGQDVTPGNRRALGHICRTCLKDVQTADRVGNK